MDLTLNFAAPSPSTASNKTLHSSHTAAKGPQRWTARMKSTQAARREARQQQAKREGENGVTVTSVKGKERLQEADIARMVADEELAGYANGKEKRRTATTTTTRQSPSTSTSTSTANPETGPSKPSPAVTAQKKQIISSLFSSLPQRGKQRQSNINITTDTESAAVLSPSNAPSLADNFDDLALRPEIIAHLRNKMALSHPTTIQKLAVPFLCDSAPSGRKDALIQAQTGSGKTLSYLLPVLQDLLQCADSLKASGRKQPLDRSVGTMAIILVPTRELASQIHDVACKLLSFASNQDGTSHRWITPGLLTGGAHRQHEKARLRKGVPLLIATVSFAHAHTLCGMLTAHLHHSLGVYSTISKRQKHFE